MGDSRSTTTFGILLSGLLSVEAESVKTPRQRRRRALRARSGTYELRRRPSAAEAPGTAASEAPPPVR